MKLQTERLIIRYFNDSDATNLYNYLSDETVVKYEPYKPLNREAASKEAKRRITDTRFLAVCLPDYGLIGNIYLAEKDFATYEIGYVFNKSYWGKGYATESLNAVIYHIFKTLKAHRITALCNPKNENSWRLLERVHFRREGHLLQNVYFFKDEKGVPLWQDTFEYGILASDFLKK